MSNVSISCFSRIKLKGLKALQEATKSIIVTKFKSKFILILLIFILIFLYLVTNIAVIYAKRVTI